MAGIIDYTQQVFTSYYEQNGGKYCYTVYPGFYFHEGAESLYIGDNLNVVALTPYGGTICFALGYDDGEWKTIIPQSFVNNKLLKMINGNMKKVMAKNPLIRVIVNKLK